MNFPDDCQLNFDRVCRDTLGRVLNETFIKSDAIKFAIASGGFSFTWKLIGNGMRIWRKHRLSRLNGALAGSIASLWLLALPVSTRRSFAVQMLLRSLQMLYNYHKKRGRVHLPAGDALMFSVACVPVMYAYALENGALPKDLRAFMIKTSCVSRKILDLNKSLVDSGCNRSDIIESFSDVVRQLPGATQQNIQLTDLLVQLHGQTGASINLPCSIIHPSSNLCTGHYFKLFTWIVKFILPLQVALNLVPAIFFKYRSFIKYPFDSLKSVSKNALRSSVFLATFISTFQVLHCAHRNLANPLSSVMISRILTNPMFQRIYYVFIGFACSIISIFVEQKKKRGELLLYVLPKSAETLFNLLHLKTNIKSLFRWIPSAVFDGSMGMLAFGIIMGFYESHSDCLNPMVKEVLVRFYGRH